MLARSVIVALLLVLSAACTTTSDEPTTTSSAASVTIPPGQSDGTAVGSDDTSPSTTTGQAPDGPAPAVVLQVAVDEARLPGFRSAAERFTTDTGVEVEFTVADYPEIVALVDEVDIVIGTHVALWRLADRGRIVPLDLGGVRDRFEPVALAAVTHAGSVFGLPFGADAVALLWNPGLIPEPAADLDDLANTCGDLPETVVCLAMGGGSEPSVLHHGAFLNAGAGGVFAWDPAGAWNVQERGLTAAGAAGLDVLGDLVDAGLVPAMSVAEARDSFVAGQAAMYVTGPWDLGLLDEQGVDYQVGGFPPVGGEDTGPLVGVQAAAVSAASDHPVIATGFLRDYVAAPDTQIQLHQADPRVPVVAEVTDDPVARGFLDSFRAGEPIPPIEAMDDAWLIVGEALARIRQGLASSSGAMAEAEAAIAAAVGEQ